MDDPDVTDQIAIFSVLMEPIGEFFIHVVQKEFLETSEHLYAQGKHIQFLAFAKCQLFESRHCIHLDSHHAQLAELFNLKYLQFPECVCLEFQCLPCNSIDHIKLHQIRQILKSLKRVDL
ncbi:hypothetical protein NL676_025498 [Syzygium grande]|nr:hypothetical protein NL676_025498 [Syzygium grande]